MDFITKINDIIAYSEMSISEFADAIDVQRSSISHIQSGRNKPSLDFLLKIKQRFPNISWNWLLEDQGSMLEEEEKSGYEKEIDNIPQKESVFPIKQEKTPLFNHKAVSGKQISKIILFYEDGQFEIFTNS